MKRLAILGFGMVAYAVFFATFVYLIAFVGNLQWVLHPWLPTLANWIPRSIDIGGTQSAAAISTLVDLALIFAFGVQHSVMARTGFKAWLKRHLPESAERSVYVVLASLMLMLLFWQWRPISAMAWTATSFAGQAIGWSVFALGYGIALLSTFLIDHFDLFGLKQVIRHFLGRDVVPAQFVTPLLYRFVRHPLYLGMILGFWGGSSMTAGHLLFSTAMTVYVLVGIHFEERDLVRHLGKRYSAYRREVPMLVPGSMRSRQIDTGEVSGLDQP